MTDIAATTDIAPETNLDGPVPAKPSLVGLTRVQLAAALGAIGVPEREQRMRVGQLWHWIYFQGASSFDSMLNVSKVLRAKLAEAYSLSRPQVVAAQLSKDGTRKWLIRMPPVDARALCASRARSAAR
jgi:23S rRNA (adenine2503-C2)-methyltransferase